MTPDLLRVLAIVAEALERPADQVGPDSDLDGLGCDALCRVDIAIEIESAFDVPIVGDATWRTSRDIAREVQRGRETR